MWNSFDKGVMIAQRSNKKILVDVYTNWCTWCKKMDTEVYTNPTILRLLHEHFVAIKLDAESNKPITFNGNSFEEAGFARQLGVSGYPTTLFFDHNASPITEYSGYATPDKFATILKFIGEDYYKSISLQKYLSNNASRP